MEWGQPDRQMGWKGASQGPFKEKLYTIRISSGPHSATATASPTVPMYVRYQNYYDPTRIDSIHRIFSTDVVVAVFHFHSNDLIS